MDTTETGSQGKDPETQRRFPAPTLGRLAMGPFFVLALVVLVITSLSLTRNYAVPLAVAVLFWFLINALADVLRRMPLAGPHLPQGLAQILAAAALLGAAFLAGRGVVANIAELSQADFGSEESAISKLRIALAGIGIEDWLSTDRIVEMLGMDRLIGFALDTARSLVSDISLVVLYVAFLLVDQRFYTAKLSALIPDETRRTETQRALHRIADEVRVYLWIMTLLSTGVALITWGSCRFVGLEGAGFWGVLAFALNFIPTIGSILAVVAPVVYALLTMSDPVLIAELVILLSATQFVAGEVVLPRLMGDSLNLSSFVIILTLVVWGAIWGPAGMFLAIPITVILVLICARFDATRPVAILLSKTGKVPVL